MQPVRHAPLTSSRLAAPWRRSGRMRRESHSGPFSLSGLVPMPALPALVVPRWKPWSRTGHPGARSPLTLIPLANIIPLWVLAFKGWPALRGKTEPRP